MKKNILISVPNNNPSHVIYLPTIWGVLKSYCDRKKTLKQNYQWLAPIILKGSPETLLAPYRDMAIDVLGLSCYSWNMLTNMKIAQVVRESHPDCFIVAGGPHVDYKNTNLFQEHPELNAVILKDGEIPFSQLLEQLLAGDLDLLDIPGLILPPGPKEKVSGEKYIVGKPPELPRTLEGSPWLENRVFFESLMADLRQRFPGRPIGIPWEIDRGCPYACTFCDWGSNTASKVRARDMEFIIKETDWIAANKIHVNFITVANFGLLDSDEKVLDAIIAAKQAHGFPRVFIWNNAKNNVDRVVSMNERAFRAGIVDFHILSVQSLDEEVLDAMKRAPVGRKVVRQVVSRATQAGIPCVAQLIFGGPADTRKKFLGSLTSLMELGVHDEYVAYAFDVLPNAPAANPEYRKKWGIETVTRRGAVNRRNPNERSEDRSTIIVATNTYDKGEFVDMYVDGRLIMALHNGGVTQFLAHFLYRAGLSSYDRFYDIVQTNLFHAQNSDWHKIYQECHHHMAVFVSDNGEDCSESMIFPDIEELNYLFNVEEYFLAKLLLQLGKFYEDLLVLMQHEFGDSEYFVSLLDYQRAVMIDPSYDRRIGRRVALSHDWPYFFSNQGGGLVYPTKRCFDLHIDRTHSGSQLQYSLDWLEKAKTPYASQETLRLWAQTVIGKHYQRVERAYFKGVGQELPYRLPYYENARHSESQMIAAGAVVAK
jgi:putative methyltransferase